MNKTSRVNKLQDVITRERPIAEAETALHAREGGGSIESPYRLEFEILGLPRTTNGSHGHWRTRSEHVKKWKRAVYAKVWHLAPAEPLACALITFTRCSSVEPDYDNLVISFKACMDGLRQAKVIVDDKKKNVGRPEYLWEYAPKGQGKIKIKVEQAIGGQKE